MTIFLHNLPKKGGFIKKNWHFFFVEVEFGNLDYLYKIMNESKDKCTKKVFLLVFLFSMTIADLGTTNDIFNGTEKD